MVIAGRQAIDGDTAQVTTGGRKLDWPQLLMPKKFYF